MYDFIPIRNDLFCAAFRGNSWPTSANVYIVLDPEGATLIDSGVDHPDCFSGLSSCLEKAGRNMKDIHTIVLTHGHPDHVGGTNEICRHTNPRVLLPELCLPEAIDSAQQDYYCIPPQVRAVASGMREFDLMGNFRRTCGFWELDKNRITPIRDGEVIKAGRYSFEAVHTPGHDIGMMCFHEAESKLLITGDLLPSTGPGSALPWYTSTAGGVDSYLTSLDRVARLEVDTVLPAHGAFHSKLPSLVEKTREMILSREAAILSLLREGPKSIEQLDARIYRPIVVQLCPWFSTVTESHLSRLERTGAVGRDGLEYYANGQQRAAGIGGTAGEES